MKYFVIFLLIFTLYAKDTTGLKKYRQVVNEAIKKSSGKQKNILQNALKMVESKEIVIGSCWDYINKVYTKSDAKKIIIFNSNKRGKYFNLKNLKPADWIYHINYSYNNIEHSGMFIDWIDKNNSKALMLSYTGEKKKIPARFKVYNIKSTYNVYRAKETEMEYIPIKEYAVKNKISIFNVMKLAKNGKIDSITKTIDGKEQLFIKKDATIKKDKKVKIEPTIKELLKEIEELKKRVEILEKKCK